MKRIYLPFAFAAALSFSLTACGGESTDQNNKADTTSTEEVVDSLTGEFGESFSAEGAIDAGELLATMAGKDSLEVTVKGKINECCKKKGCWMTVDLGNGEEMRVRFKDYGFFVPKNADGLMAIFNGWAYADSISVEDQRHYLEDAGASEEEINAITEPKAELSFMANGVKITNE